MCKDKRIYELSMCNSIGEMQIIGSKKELEERIQAKEKGRTLISYVRSKDTTGKRLYVYTYKQNRYLKTYMLKEK